MGYRITKQRRLTPLRLLSTVKVTDLKHGTSNYPKLGGGLSSRMQSSPEFPSSIPMQNSQGQPSSTGESSTHSQSPQLNSTNVSSSPDIQCPDNEDVDFIYEEIPGRIE
jgi:hypothetical protein